MRIFCVVGRLLSVNMPVVSTDMFLKIFKRVCPCASSPIIPQAKTCAPSVCKLLITLPAPPGRISSEVTLIIGMGASCDIRLTSPHTYLSSIKSPTTIILGEPRFLMMLSNLSAKERLPRKTYPMHDYFLRRPFRQVQLLPHPGS